MNINEKIMIFENIKKFIFEYIKTMKIILEREILFEYKFEKFEYIYTKIINILWYWKIEYSFIDNRMNKFIKIKNKLIKILLKNSLIQLFFIKYI